MKKIFSFLLIAAGLMISTQSKAENTVSLTIGDQVTEYATLENAVAAAEIAGEGIIKLLPAYDRYPKAWLTDLTGVDEPEEFINNEKGLFTFHAFNPSGDNALFDKVKAKQALTPAEEARAKQVVKEINPELVSVPDEMIDLTLDLKYLGGYANWASDFEVYFDADVDSAEYTLAGNYGEWGWYPNNNVSSLSIDMEAYQRICLLNNNFLPKKDDNLKYWELMTSVNHFHCGIVGKNANANAGKTFWCELYLYKPGNKNIKILIDRTPYHFPIKPIVTDNEVEETETNKEILAELTKENEGVKAMTDSMTNIYPATSEYESDKKKTIVVILTDIKVEVIQGEYDNTLEAITYNVTPKYIDENGDMQTIPNEYITEPITFRLPVASKFAGKKVDVFHKANGATTEDYVGSFAVQELNGSYFVELSAQEFSKYIIKAAKNYYERETTSGMIGTLCVHYDIAKDSLTNAGAEFFEINYRNHTTTTAVTEVEGVKVDSLVAGKAYVFHATGTLIHVGWPANAEGVEKADTTGSMVGNLSGATIKPATLYETGKCEPYIITSAGVFRPCGPNATLAMNRAFLNMANVPTTKAPSAPGRRIRLTANGANITTEIENVNANANANHKMMIDGKFVIVKDGKMFNAIGQEL